MRRISVKDRILLHLSWYSHLKGEFEQSYSLTQDGIAKKLGINRSHVAVNLKRLKDKDMVLDNLAHVTGTKRQRKTYHLAPKGLEYINEIKHQIYNKTIMFRDLDGNVTEVKIWDLSTYLFPFLNEYTSYFDIINYISSDEIFDAKTFIEEQKVKIEKRNKEESKVGSKGMGDIEQDQTSNLINDRQEKTGTSQSLKSSITTLNNLNETLTTKEKHPLENPNKSSALYSTPYYVRYQNYYHQIGPYPFTYQMFLQYYYWGRKIPSHEERKNQILGEMKSFFFISVVFLFFGSLAVLPAGRQLVCGFFFLLVISIIFASIGFSIGFRRLPFLESKGRRLILTMSVFYIGIFIFLIDLFIFYNAIILDFEVLLLTIFGMLGFLILISYGKQIKTKYREEIAFIVGIFSILFGIFSIFLIPLDYLANPFIFSPFIILFGVTCIVVGNELLGKIENRIKYTKVEKYIISGTGTFLVTIILLRLYINEYNSNNLTLCYICDGLWLMLGGYLVSFRFVDNKHYTLMRSSIKITLPIGLGTIMILFGIFLFMISKLIEGIVEVIIGLVIIAYDAHYFLDKSTYKEKIKKMSFPFFVIFIELITLTVILIG